MSSQVEQTSTGPQSHARLGHNLLQAGDLSGAEQAFRKAAELDPSFPGIHSALADVLNHQGRRDEALTMLRELVAEGNPDPHVHAKLGQILAQSGDLSDAERAIRKAAELGPVVSGFRIALADFLNRQGRREEAIDILRQLVADGSTHPNVHVRLGHLLTQSGDLPGAEQAFRKATELDPDKPGIRSALAEALNRQGRREEAIDILRHLVADGSTDPHIHFRLGHLFIQSNDLSGAEQTFRKAAELDPSFPGVRRTLAGVLNRQGQREQALAILRQLVAEQSPDPHVHGTLGQILAQSGDLSGAEQAFGKAIALDPSVASFRTMLAGVLERQAKREPAPEAPRDVAAEGSADPQVHARLGHALIQSGDLQGAEQAIRKAVALDPGAPSFRSILAEVLNRQGKNEEALELLRQLAAEGSTDPHVHARLCRLLVQSRDLPGAKQAFRKAVELDPTIADSDHGLVALLGHETSAEPAATAQPEHRGDEPQPSAPAQPEDAAGEVRAKIFGQPDPIAPRKGGFFRTLFGRKPKP